MRDVAVTEGDKVEAQIKLGWQVDYWPVGHLVETMDELTEAEVDAQMDEYRARCFVPGHWVTVCTGTETYAAQALSIDDVGRLVVQREGGRTEALRCGEVTIRPTKTE